MLIARPARAGTRAVLAAALLLTGGAAARARAADDALAFFREESVTVVRKSPESARAAAGIVTVITREEIVDSGARDLIDVLLQVPGVYFGQDTQGMVGIGFRGNWAHEGKALLLIDGQPINEINYATLQFGNHFPVSQIQRVEIIRGPGSVVYGGFAEFLVVNVITRSPDDLRGGAASWSYGRMAHAVGHSDVGLELGGDAPGVPGLSGTLAGFYGQGNRSDGTYRDFSGVPAPLAGDNTLDPRYLNASLNYKDLRLRAIADGYHTGTVDGFGPVIPRDVQTFPAYWLEAKYDAKPAPGLTLTPQLNYEWQKPWLITNKASPIYQDMTLEQYTAGLTASYDSPSALSVLAGASAYEQRAKLNDGTSVGVGLQRLFEGTMTSVRYRNLALFGQGVYAGELADLTLGLRFETHSKYGTSYVPRAAATKVIGPFHAKLLYSQAFRVPAVQNISINPGLKPERTTIWETEVGWRSESLWSATLNLFDITAKDPIVFGSSSSVANATEAYFNFDRTGTRGAELALSYSRARGHAKASYSFATASGKNDVSQYLVPGRSSVLLAAPMHKVAFNGSVRTVGNLRVSPSAVWIGDRYAYVMSDGQGNGLVGRIPPVLLLNLFASYPDAWIRGLEVGAGVFNVLNAYNPFPQPYNSNPGGHPPTPGPSREYELRVSYAFGAR